MSHPSTNVFVVRHETVDERFDRQFERTGANECWTWTGTKSAWGYGVFGIGRRQVRAHRYAYMWQHGEIPSAVHLDHLCHTPDCDIPLCSHRLCVNPRHLTPSSLIPNVMRGNSPAARNARKDRCKRDHEFDQVRITPAGRVGRSCSICKAINARERRERRAMVIARDEPSH